MLVTVNGQPIDYTLEHERLLGEVVAAIEKWLNGARMVVTSLRLGDRELAGEPEPAWAPLPVDRIARLDISACSLAELEREQVGLIGQYVGELAACLEGRRSVPAGTLAGFADLAATARLRLDMTAGSAAAAGLAELEHLMTGGSPQAVEAWPEGIRDRALAAIASLREAARERLVEIERPADALRSAASGLAGCSRDLGQVSLLLQTGQDDKAMAHINRFAGLLQSVLRAVAHLQEDTSGAPRAPLIEGRALGDFVGDLNAILRQAAEALGARDTVLLGDLLEYEVAPRLATLSAFLNRPEI